MTKLEEVIDILVAKELKARNLAIAAEQNAMVYRTEERSYREAWQTVEDVFKKGGRDDVS